MKPIRVNQTLLTFRFLADGDEHQWTQEVRLVGCVAIGLTEIWKNFTSPQVKVANMVKLTNLPTNVVMDGLYAMAKAGWLKFDNQDAPFEGGYCIPPARINETIEKQKQYREKIAERAKAQKAA